MELFFSFIVPVFNRPDEIRELLESLVEQTYKKAYEIVIVEDGSELSSDKVIKSFSQNLPISYYSKHNTGPGDSRNYGMKRAKGDYFIILDSDCILPNHYLETVEASLKSDYTDCYGGPDTAHKSFSNVQKAINYAMTSVWTTGGIRGNKVAVDKFQPRSFNMGISREAFENTGGFGNIHPGEDPDLSMRLWKNKFETSFIAEAFVYHKRRIDFNTFFTQLRKFGMVRPILNKWHPGSAKITYWFPTLFSAGLLGSVIFLFTVPGLLQLAPIACYVLYLSIIFLHAFWSNKKLTIALLSVIAVLIQFIGYGYGFLKSTIWVNFSRRKPQELFPELFF